MLLQAIFRYDGVVRGGETISMSQVELQPDATVDDRRDAGISQCSCTHSPTVKIDEWGDVARPSNASSSALDYVRGYELVASAARAGFRASRFSAHGCQLSESV